MGFFVPKLISQYRVFIGSPGGLSEERELFRKILEKCSRHHGDEKGVLFHPVGWEDTVGGAGRPQAQINDDLKECDYAVFVLHDRWGTPTGDGHSSGTEEEWKLAEELYKKNKIRNIALFFKAVDPIKLSDPGDQLKPVIKFKKEIEENKKYLFNQYKSIGEFSDMLDGHLARWLKDHKDSSSVDQKLEIPEKEVGVSNQKKMSTPTFKYWIDEARQIVKERNDYEGAIYCVQKATVAASTDFEKGAAKHMLGVVQVNKGNLAEAITAFSAIIDKYHNSNIILEQQVRISALFNKGVALGKLERNIEAIEACDEIINSAIDNKSIHIERLLAKSMMSKASNLGKLNKRIEQIDVYNILIEMFSNRDEIELQEQVSQAFLNMAFTFDEISENEKEIDAYSALIDKFGESGVLSLREDTATAYLNKGITLGILDRPNEEIEVYDHLIKRLVAEINPIFQEQLAKAFLFKGMTLKGMGRHAEARTAYNEVIRRFESATEPSLKAQVDESLSEMKSLPKE